MNREKITAQFGRNLSEARGWAGLSQTQLAQQVSMRQVEARPQPVHGTAAS